MFGSAGPNEKNKTEKKEDYVENQLIFKGKGEQTTLPNSGHGNWRQP